MNDSKSYAKPVDLGEVMTGESVCEARGLFSRWLMHWVLAGRLADAVLDDQG